jgi:hypothetical protein
VKVVTLRKIPPELARLIRRRAEEHHTSASRTVIELLEERAGSRTVKVGKKKPQRILHHDLDALAGSWTKTEASEFDRVLATQRGIDLDLWK